jgi:hypothetical protein
LDSGIIRDFKVKYRKMLLEFLLSHGNLAALDDALKKINVGHAIQWISQAGLKSPPLPSKNCFHQVGVNEVEAKAKQDDELAQEEEEMIQFAQQVGFEAPETVMEDIPTSP